MFIEQGYIQRINFEIFNRFGYYNYHLIHWTASWLLGITYVTNIKGIHYPSSTDGMMHFFDPICFYAHFFCFLPWEVYFVVRYLHNQTMLRDYSKTKNRLE
jgi:hypothetical protein